MTKSFYLFAIMLVAFTIIVRGYLLTPFPCIPADDSMKLAVNFKFDKQSG